MVFSGCSFRSGGIGRGGFVVAFGKTGHELADQLAAFFGNVGIQLGHPWYRHIKVEL